MLVSNAEVFLRIFVDKYGLEEAKKRQSRGLDAAKGGRAGKGKPKSPEHRKKLGESTKRFHQNKNMSV